MASYTPSSSSSSSSSSRASATTNQSHLGGVNTGQSQTIASTSYLKPPVMRRRILHQRRASQPAFSSALARPVGGKASSSPMDDNELYSSSSAYEDGNTSSEDDDWEGKRESLEYLDLSPTLLHTLVSLRTQILDNCTQLEQRVRSFCPYPSSPTTDVLPSRPDSQFAATFYAHLDALKEDLRKLLLSLPTSAPSVSLPLAFSKAPSQLPAFPTLSPLRDVDYAAALNSLAAKLPVSGVHLLEKVQARFEALQDSVSAMTLRDCFYWSRRAGEPADNNSSSSITSLTISQDRTTRRLSLNSSQQVLSRQFESIFESIKERGGQVQSRAASVAKAAKETEERLYTAAVELARGGQRLIRYEHLPTLWKNNEHILSGYRFIPSNDIGALLKSTFQIHNETGNIMTHLIGALIVTPLFWPSKDSFDDHTTPMDRMVQSIYLVAALKCLILSVSWHVMAGCSDACWFERFACVDYTGIAWLVAASVWTLVYNAFYCQPNLAMFYSLTTLMVGLVGAIVPWASWFNDRENKPIRIAVFLTMCFTGVGPFLHASLSHGFIKTSLFFSPILPSVGSYIFGLIFYATQFPERIAPGRFDVVGHAHQIWHISIVVAILLHYRATFIWHQGRFDFSCAINPLRQSSTSSAIIDSVAGGAADLANQVTSSLFGDNSVIQKATDLSVADEIVHGWRISAGRLGDGMVGRVWDWCVDRIMATF